MLSLNHFMPVPIVGSDGNSIWSLGAILGIIFWSLPFIAVYIWHTAHDHKNHKNVEKKMDEIIDVLKKILDKK